MKKILLVEDEPFLTDIYTTKLERTGFEVQLVTEGDKVLGVLKEFKPDLLVLDIILPNLDGWEVLRKIRKEKGFEELPVIILSNLGQKQEVMKGLDLGATKYLIKAHYTPSELVEEIKKILEENEQ
jgi:DNA-binding response OmpR family regulator